MSGGGEEVSLSQSLGGVQVIKILENAIMSSMNKVTFADIHLDTS